MMKQNQTMQHRSVLTVLTLVLGALAAGLLSAFSSVALSQTATTVAATVTSEPVTTTVRRKANGKAKSKAKTKAKSKNKTMPSAKVSSQRMSSQEKSFAQADVDKTGKLTKKQAFNAKMYDVDRYFFDIDTDIDGYVTQAELASWKASPVRTAPRPRGDRLDRFVTGDGSRK